MATTWDPAQYLRHADHRGRPFDDLLARVPQPSRENPRVLDLGCGPGNTTARLLDRWPDAHVTGLDNSPAMLAAAAPRATRTAAGGSLDFAAADAARWAPDEPVDVLISNATLQWVPGHLDLLAGWAGALRPGGSLAIQVPGNFDAPSHRALRAVGATARWRTRLGGVLERQSAVPEPAAYLDRLAGLGLAPDVWETTYLHLLPGEDPVLDWVTGTALRPALDLLPDADERAAFLADCAAALRVAYPPRPHGTVFPFRRLFAVGRRGAAEREPA